MLILYIQTPTKGTFKVSGSLAVKIKSLYLESRVKKPNLTRF